MSIYSVQSCISKKITIELSARVIYRFFTSQLPIDIPENSNAGYRVNHMFYIIDVDNNELVAEFEDYEKAFRKVSDLQAWAAECETYIDYEIIEAEDWSECQYKLAD